jgi:hypothetical protein
MLLNPSHAGADRSQPFDVRVRLRDVRSCGRIAVLVAGALVAAGCSSGSRHATLPSTQPSVSASHTATAVPVLGYSKLYRAGSGWGSVQPATLTLGHTAARYWYIHPRLGALYQLRWTDWGTKTAHARGVKVAWKPHVGYYKKRVAVAVRAYDPAGCPDTPSLPAYTRMQIRSAIAPGAPLPSHWTDWPLHILSDGNLCKPPFQPLPYVKPGRNALGVYYRGDNWNWRSNTLCVGPGVHLVPANFALQDLVRYSPSAARADIHFFFRNFSDQGGYIPRGTAVPLKVWVANPTGRLSDATISLSHFGDVTATYPDDFYHPGLDPEPIRRRPLLPGTYTMVVETMQGSQIACSGAFVRSS